MCNKACLPPHAGRGLTLIELLVFIVILGVAATAMLTVFGSLTRNSASLLPDKQAQAIAASVLAEVLAQPSTFCDPNDGNAPTATSPAGCASLPEAIGPELGESRGGVSPFDNVNDYDSLAQYPISMLNPPPATGVTLLTGLPGYTYQVTVAYTNAVPNVTVTPNDALLVTVTVRLNGTVAAQLQGVRIRYAPNT